MLKSLYVVVGLLLSFNYCFGQEIDPRIIQNKGLQEAEKIYKYNKNSYNYLVFELDSSYQIVPKSSLAGKERSLIQKNEKLTAEVIAKIGTSEFNFQQYGIKLSSTEASYFMISKEMVLVFKPIIEITGSFKKSPLNTK